VELDGLDAECDRRTRAERRLKEAAEAVGSNDLRQAITTTRAEGVKVDTTDLQQVCSERENVEQALDEAEGTASIEALRRAIQDARRRAVSVNLGHLEAKLQEWEEEEHALEYIVMKPVRIRAAPRFAANILGREVPMYTRLKITETVEAKDEQCMYGRIRVEHEFGLPNSADGWVQLHKTDKSAKVWVAKTMKPSGAQPSGYAATLQPVQGPRFIRRDGHYFAGGQSEMTRRMTVHEAIMYACQYPEIKGFYHVGPPTANQAVEITFVSGNCYARSPRSPWAGQYTGYEKHG